VQIVDPDRMSNPNLGWDTPTMRGGVELDPVTTEAVAYHVRKAHPYDAGVLASTPTMDGVANAYVWEPVPARDPVTGRSRFIHLYAVERPGQTRGKPAMTAVMPMFHMLDHYERAELQAAVVNALIAVLVESQLPMEQILQLFGGNSEEYLLARREHQDRAKLQGGAMIPMFPGDKATGFAPQRPNAQFGAFTETILRNIGTSLGLPLELLMKDFSKTNYSSARAALLEAWRHFNNRRDWLVTHWADEIYALWLEEAANRGEIEAPTFYRDKSAWCRCEWIGDGKGWVDPLKEAQASEQRRKSRVSTLQRECAEQGLDWRQVLEQQAAEKKYAEGLGIELEPLPVAPFTRGAQPDPGIDQQDRQPSDAGAGT
jgi:lambda family phage portal protein